ncbi:hypothetical protein [Montanilutibacter psychrotolerans]|uniref:WxL domain-containing protein n=1 Tax=Montanilutibacter psychrotolerans TaxID=1327343 RepID=A0A3M8T3X6_9GAMM|nr:hypothetical protein [Lysobacter psychrotolerans]RNF86396.1 hypothetical protein EER27_02975 [Lysobacter psychrotolerans]
MRLSTKAVLTAAALSCVPMIAQADSQFVSGAGNASAHLDFRITVPRVLFLQVGTGTASANNGTIDLIDFVAPTTTMGNGTAVAGTGGDVGAGTVSAKVVGNNGDVTFSSTTTGPLTSGTDTISYNEITATAAPVGGATLLPHPTLIDAGTTSIPLAAAGATKVVNREARWTFTYDNTAMVAAGTYGGVNTGHGRVLYTAVMP